MINGNSKNARSRLAISMIKGREPVQKIVDATGYTRGTVLRLVDREWGPLDKYPGRRGRCPETKCWTCAKATGYCTWSAFFVPVEGWDATANDIYSKTEKGEEIRIGSFFVRSCPEYEPDEPRGNK